MNSRAQWKNSSSFWREMKDGDHVCQVYESEADFLDSLTGFVGHGLWSDEAVVVIATAAHVTGLEARLRDTGLDLAHLRADDRLITLSPEMTLARFMVDGWPQADRFDAAITQVVARARGKGRGVRAFGEMVALLWEQGQFAATVRVEHLWQKLAQREKLQVLCSYPRRSFARGSATARFEIAANHTQAFAT